MTAVKNTTAIHATNSRVNMKRRFLFLLCIAFPLCAGYFTGALTQDKMDIFNTLKKPPLTPPGYIFPIVWGILYLLMGISSYIAIINSQNIHQAIYTIIPFVFQLVLNILWGILFFGLRLYDGAFACLVLLWIMLLRTMIVFYIVAPAASILLAPYLTWIVFAGYLNWEIIVLN